jgi:CRISPR-associated protein Cst2
MITGLSVAARVTMSAHSLNNEGARNNAIIPRQLDIVWDKEIVQANAVSGDTIKHSFVSYLRACADRDGRNGDGDLPMCEPCRRGNPNRLNADKEFQAVATDRGRNNEQVLTELIRRCVIDDAAGLLVTQGNRNAPRHSTVQFGWQLGIPEQVRTNRYTHVKLVPGDPGAESSEGSNLGQNIFTRPASSGNYALVALCELNRVGVNDISVSPVLDEAQRRARSRAMLEALYLTLCVPDGAQRNTQLPHFQGISGAVCASLSALPPVLHSPLADDFVGEMERCSRAFGRVGADLHVIRFDSAGELGTVLSELADTFAARA